MTSLNLNNDVWGARTNDHQQPRVAKIVLPKSLDVDSAGDETLATSPVPNIAEALFNGVPEPRIVSVWATCSSVRGSSSAAYFTFTRVPTCFIQFERKFTNLIPNVLVLVYIFENWEQLSVRLGQPTCMMGKVGGVYELLLRSGHVGKSTGTRKTTIFWPTANSSENCLIHKGHDYVSIQTTLCYHIIFYNLYIWESFPRKNVCKIQQDNPLISTIWIFAVLQMKGDREIHSL